MSNQQHERYLEQLEECKQEQAYIEADEAAAELAVQMDWNSWRSISKSKLMKRDVIIDMSNKVEELMDMFPGIVKDQSLLYNIAGNVPIDEEKMNEVVKLKMLRILLAPISYDELRKYLGYEVWIP